MALEFALRPRISLEPPAPRRRLRRLRLPPLALPVTAYWLVMAGATHVLLGLSAEEPVNDEAPISAEPPDTRIVDSAPSPSPPPSPEPPAATPNVASLAPEPVSEPAPAPEPAPERERDLERAPEPTTKRPAPVAQRALAARPEPPAPPVRSRAPAGEHPDPFAPVEEPAPRPREAAQAFVEREPAHDEAPATSLPSCESAAASANETVDLGAARGAPDLSREALASVLENGAYLARCAIPARTALEICAAVRDGKVVGVSVASEPRSPAINACVRRAVAALRFPRSARLDVTRTRFEAAR